MDQNNELIKLMTLAFIATSLLEKVHVHADDVKFIAQPPTKNYILYMFMAVQFIYYLTI